MFNGEFVGNGVGFFSFIKVVDPFGMLLGRNFFDEFMEDFFGIADDWDVRVDEFADFSGVNVYVDDFCIGRKCGNFSGDAVIKAHADGNDGVAFLNG